MLTGFDLCRAAMAVTNTTAPEQSVLLVLAIMADEKAQCWPGATGATGLTGKTKLGERTVRRALQGLKAAGHITILEIVGRGNIYTVHPCPSGTPAAAAPCQSGTPAAEAETPAAVAPKLPRTTIPTKASPSSVKREQANATRVPTNFEPHPADGSLTAKAMDAWPPGEREEQVEHFVDHHTAAGTLSKDWQASWRTWVKNWKRFNGKRSHHRPADRIRNSLVAACAVAATGGPAG